MVVPLILLGTVTKLSIAIAATHRTRWWWLPGVLAMGMGGVEASIPDVPRAIGEGSVVIGACGLVIARLLRPAVPSRA
jgi:hypothetical protein